jgi:hypothetical protein
MRRNNVGVLLVLVLGAMLLFVSSANSEALRWNAPTTFTDNSLISQAQQATITYYVRLDQPNPMDQTGGLGNKVGWYYIGEARNGVLFFPADNSLASLMRSYGFSGKTVKFTASAAFVDTDGVERDSSLSSSITWVVPAEVVATLTINPVSGTFTSPQSVVLSTSTAGASIRYTTDGATPSATVGTVYTGPIAVTATTTIKAIAYKAGMSDTALVTGVYTFPVVYHTPGTPSFIIVR